MELAANQGVGLTVLVIRLLAYVLGADFKVRKTFYNLYCFLCKNIGVVHNLPTKKVPKMTKQASFSRLVAFSRVITRNYPVFTRYLQF